MMQRDPTRIAVRCFTAAALLGLIVGLWMLIPGQPGPSPSDTLITPGETKEVELSEGSMVLYWQSIQHTAGFDLERLSIDAIGTESGNAAVIDLYPTSQLIFYVGDNYVWEKIGVAQVRESGRYNVSVELTQRDPGEGALIIPAPTQSDGDLGTGWYVVAVSTSLLVMAAVVELVSVVRMRRGASGPTGSTGTPIPTVERAPRSMPNEPPWRPEP